jgi:hypothetical protein
MSCQNHLQVTYTKTVNSQYINIKTTKYNTIQCNIKYQDYLKQAEVRSYQTCMWIKSICIQYDANSSTECSTGCN